MRLDVFTAALVALIVACASILTAMGRMPPEWCYSIYTTVLGAILGYAASYARSRAKG